MSIHLNSKNRFTYVYVLLLIDFLYLVTQFIWLKSSVSSDFVHFYYSSKRFVSGDSIFFPGGDTLAFSSTLTYFFFIPLTYFTPLIASNIFIICNYLLVFVIVLLIIKLSNRKITLTTYTIILTLIIYSFPSRSIISNGTIGFMTILATICFIVFYRSHRYFYSGIFIYTLFEFKIYLAVPLLIFLVINRKFDVIKSFLICFALIQLIILKINPSGLIYYYLKLLFQRMSTLDVEIDQMALQNILKNFGISRVLSWIITIVFIFYVCKRYLNMSKYNFYPELLLACLPLASVYFHRQDAIFGVIALCIFLIYPNYKKNLMVPLILLANFGNSNLLIALLCNILLFGVLILLRRKIENIIFILICCTSLQAIQVYVLLHYGWQNSYILWSVLGFLFQYSIFNSCLRNLELISKT